MSLTSGQAKGFAANSLISRSWNGTPISRRTTDGYVNATAMCKANGRQWSKYRETDRCQEYIDALAQTSDFGGLNPIETRAGNGGGTWIHPQLAVDLARWISAPFAVWMDGWFLDEVAAKRAKQKVPLPLDTKGAQVIVARKESNKDLGAMAKRHEIPYAATHQVRNHSFWGESTESLKERAGTSKWHEKADIRTQMLTWYVNDRILREAEAKEMDGLEMDISDVKLVSAQTRQALEPLEGEGFKASFMPARISPARAERMLKPAKDCQQGSLF